MLAVSIVVPVRNEVQSLPALIASLLHQTYQPEEIIIVDGGSTDGTTDWVRRTATTEPTLRLIEAGLATPGRGRNVGIEEARHDWIALIDAGTRAEPAWLERLVAAAERRTDARIVYGSYEPVTDTFFTRCASLAYVPPKYAIPGGATRGPATMSMMIRRDAWRAVGGFPDLRAAEDLIFFSRVVADKLPVAWAPDAVVWWQMQPGLASTFRRFATYSRANVLAGMERQWHYGVARQYAVAAACVLLGVWHHPLWFLAPPLGLVARTARSLWQRSGDRGWRALDPVQFVGVLGIIFVLDIATFVGWVQALGTSTRRDPTGFQ